MRQTLCETNDTRKVQNSKPESGCELKEQVSAQALWNYCSGRLCAEDLEEHWNRIAHQLNITMAQLNGD